MSDRGNNESGASGDEQASPKKTRLFSFFPREKLRKNGPDPADDAEEGVPEYDEHAMVEAMPEEHYAAEEEATEDEYQAQRAYVYDDTVATEQVAPAHANPATLHTPMPSVRTTPGTQPRPTPPPPAPARPAPQPAARPSEPPVHREPPPPPARDPVPHAPREPAPPVQREPAPHVHREPVQPVPREPVPAAPREHEPPPARDLAAHRQTVPAPAAPPREPARSPVPRPQPQAAPAPTRPAAPLPEAAGPETEFADNRHKPVTEDSIASVVAGRSFENAEAERAFLLTLSRDQRMKYAELVHADERLELDLERHNLEVDRLVYERERAEISERIRHRENAFRFANNAMRMLFALNGIGAVVLMGVWGYLAGVPGARFLSAAFGIALTTFAVGTICSALTAACSYGAQALTARPDDSPRRHYAIIAVRVMAIVFAVLSFCLFVFGVILAGYGLRAS